MEKAEDFLYFAAVVAAGMVAWFLLSTLLARTERKRAERIARLKRFEPIRTRAPDLGGTEASRERALENLGSRFSIIRRTLLTLLLVVWLAVAAAPFLNELSSVRETAVRSARESRYLAGEEDPQFWVMALEQQAIQCWLAMWTRSPADAWSIRVETGERIVRELAARGIKTHSYELRPGRAR